MGKSYRRKISGKWKSLSKNKRRAIKVGGGLLAALAAYKGGRMAHKKYQAYRTNKAISKALVGLPTNKEAMARDIESSKTYKIKGFKDVPVRYNKEGEPVAFRRSTAWEFGRRRSRRSRRRSRRSRRSRSRSRSRRRSRRGKSRKSRRRRRRRRSRKA